jgi:hypothetical protein
MRALLTDLQVEELQKLNSDKATFVPCWSYLGGVTVNQNELDIEGFEAHKELMQSYNLQWVEDEVIA